MSGTLTLCGTPIGNLSDLSERAIKTIGDADLIFAEDTRRTAKLLAHLGISVPMRSFFAGNEQARLSLLRDELEAGRDIVLVSDAGMPIISDPGASAVQVAVDCGAAVGVVPGPSAVVTALVVSGFNGDRFIFDGFLPRKGHARTVALEALVDEQRTVVLFAAPSRVAADLADLASVAGSQRRVVVTRELTKVFEEIWRGTLGEAADHWTRDGTTKGEFTVVIEGAQMREPSMTDAVAAALGMISKGASTSDAVKTVTATHGVRRNELYENVVKERS
ncbi:MAG: 16S rRNA (cytidine(1402)-2'-O)-methyltransferase [Actinomycetota bacterium]